MKGVLQNPLRTHCITIQLHLELSTFLLLLKNSIISSSLHVLAQHIIAFRFIYVGNYFYLMPFFRAPYSLIRVRAPYPLIRVRAPYPLIRVTSFSAILFKCFRTCFWMISLYKCIYHIIIKMWPFNWLRCYVGEVIMCP